MQDLSALLLDFRNKSYNLYRLQLEIHSKSNEFKQNQGFFNDQEYRDSAILL